MPKILYVLALGAFALITTELGIIGILPEISTALGVSIQKAGWLLSGFALTVALAAPLIVLLVARLNRKTSLCIVLAVFVTSNLASVWVPSFGWLLALRVIPAIVHPVFWSVAMTAAAQSVGEDRSSRAVSLVFTGMSAGIVLGIPIAAFVAGVADWRAAFLVFAGLNLVALVAHVVFLPSMPVDVPQSTGSQVGVLRRPMLWWNLAVQVVLTAAVFSIYGYMAEYLGRVSGMGSSTISVMMLVFGVAGVVGTLLAGRLMSRDLSRTVFGFLVAMIPVLLLLFLFGHSQAATIAVVMVWGLVQAAAVPLCQALILRAAPEAPEFANSLFTSFGNIGITVGTTIGGAAIAHWGIAALPLASIVILLAATLLFMVERHQFSGSAKGPALRAA
jgi:DHA1 family inner membrane transport protein